MKPLTEIKKEKKMNNLFKLYKMTKSQRSYLSKLRLRFKKGEITIEEGHKLWRNHPDYIKQYGVPK